MEKTRRGEDFFTNFAAVLSYARDNRADFLVHCGDLFFRSRVPAGIADRAYRMLHQLAAAGIRILIVPGNHERATLPVSLWLNDPGIYIFNRPRAFVFNTDSGHCLFAGFPFQKGNIRRNFKTLLQATGWEEHDGVARFLCMHQLVEDAVVGPGDFRFTAGPQTISKNDIPSEFSAVLAGHVHRAQILNCPGGSKMHRTPVIYSGSVERTSSAERYEMKGFYDLNFRVDRTGNICYTGIDFVTLDTRPMADLWIPTDLGSSGMITYLKDRLIHMEPGSIIYFRCRQKGAERNKVFPDTARLRQIMPAGMIGKFTRSCFGR